MFRRTHHCGELRQEHIGQTVNLAGWVASYRDHGGILFVDVRDFAGRTQVVFDPDLGPELYDIATKFRLEDVIEIRGQVKARESVNPKIPTGEIEVVAEQCGLLNKAENPPILPDDQSGEAGEEVRLRYRYIDLRRARMQHILRTRHRVTQLMRNYLSDRGFIEIETPFLCRSTPEGARDFLVPSRLNAGSFYALPQSPQLFKQILMAGGCDKYMQIVRCFRDEDPRADRQAEFTQLDIEMSFVTPDDIIELLTGLYRRIWQEILGYTIGEVPQMTYQEAMERFGIDRPDLRFGMELVDVSDLARRSEFRVFQTALAQERGVVKAICVPGGANALSRKQTDALGEWVKQFGAGGLPIVKVGADGKSFEAGISKFIAGLEGDLIARMQAKPGDLICFAADRYKVATRVLGELRNRVARELDLIDRSQWKFLWVVDFPLLEWNDEQNRWDSPHHPFTAPHPDDLHLLESDPGKVRSVAYDFVVNGSEIAGGSIRIHRADVQQRVFRFLGISEEDARLKFSFLLDALRYGCPPHGGVAAGLDRAIMHLTGTDNIRDVIAFPKTLNGFDLMTQAPSPVDEAQLEELHLRLRHEGGGGVVGAPTS